MDRRQYVLHEFHGVFLSQCSVGVFKVGLPHDGVDRQLPRRRAVPDKVHDVVAVGRLDDTAVAGLAVVVEQPVVEFCHHLSFGHVFIQTAAFFGAGVITELLCEGGEGFFCFIAGLPALVNFCGFLQGSGTGSVIGGGTIGTVGFRCEEDMTDVFGNSFVTVRCFGDHQHRVGVFVLDDGGVTVLAGEVEDPLAGVGGNFVSVLAEVGVFDLLIDGTVQFLLGQFMVGGCHGSDHRGVFGKVVLQEVFELCGRSTLCQTVGVGLGFFFSSLLFFFGGGSVAGSSEAEVILKIVGVLVAGFVFLEKLFVVFVCIGVAVIDLAVVFAHQGGQLGVVADHVLADTFPENGEDILVKVHADRFGGGTDILYSGFHCIEIAVFQLDTVFFGGFAQHEYLLQIAFRLVHEHIEPCDAVCLTVILLFQALGHIESLKNGILSPLTVSVIEQE